ncbi:DgyrCDS13445 [Dimorphilus gyrociliatus]|uniref:DgyrCDS13445 n=1 Tax=Dimorphilus gyrociliatus TaxID=2664684 RepID=A0A7I8WAR2_9ANNE|nr:DgyrCDS13445 [Dimorphilus gyrociliatus]
MNGMLCLKFTLFLVVFCLLADNADSVWRRRRRRCRRVDCQWGQWSEWSECTKPCGFNGVNIRSRSVVRQSSCGGRACEGSNVENKQCKLRCQHGSLFNNKCKCKKGWSGECCDIDINECLNNQHNCSQICINTYGSFECKCKRGYFLSLANSTCLDIDECTSGLHNCTANSKCNNTEGSYQCGECKKGYTGNQEIGCKNIRVCSNDGLCPYDHSECKDVSTLQNGYRCVCKKGYAGNGTECGIDNDGDGISEEELTCCQKDTCPNFDNNRIENFTNFVPYFYKSNFLDAPIWKVDNNTVTQLRNSFPTVFLNDYVFNGVDLQLIISVNSSNEYKDNDYIGLVFGFINSTNYIAALWKREDQIYNGFAAYAGLHIKAIKASTWPVQVIPNLLWSTNSVEDQTETIWKDTRKVPWEYDVDYYFRLEYRPKYKKMSLTVERLKARP